MRKSPNFPGNVPKKWTDRKKLFVALVARGNTPAQICEIMCITHKTYVYYQASVMWLLNALTMPNMIARALQENIITLEDTLRFKVYTPTKKQTEKAKQYLGIK